MNKLIERKKYVEQKAKMAEDIQKKLGQKSFNFNINNIFDDERTYLVFNKLRKESKELYILITERFFLDVKPKNEYEKLIWSSEIIDYINNNGIHNIIKNFE